VTRFDASEFPTKVAYEVPGFELDRELVTEKELGFLNRAAHYGVTAAHEAILHSGLDPKAGGERTAVCLGVGMVSPDFDWYDDVFIPKKFMDKSIKRHIRFFPDQLSAVAARMLGAKGGVTTVHTACASSGQSLGEAYEMVAYGDADVVLTGGADCMINPYYFAGFSLLGALSKRNGDAATASRPFDKDRDGFVLGEGACMLVFEDYEHAKARGAKIVAEVVGYGVTESAYRITDLHPEGTGPIEAMQMAVDDAGIDAADVGYLNAHGTSTLLNDRIESLAVTKVFPAPRCDVRVSSTKSMTGHLISAAGAIEFATCLMALRDQVLPPSANLFTQDPECRVTLTGPEATPHELRYALSNSVGFGGSNTALIAGRVEA
jgi:3-oxoacyl-(acyl-carrier-protein) synthase